MFFGSCLPDEVCSRNEQGSAAANNFQLNILKNLIACGVESVEGLTVYPIAAYPRSNVLRVKGDEHVPFEGLRLHVVGFCNLGPLKPFSQLLSLFMEASRMRLTNSFLPDIVLTYNPNIRISIPALLTGLFFKIPVVCIVADVQPFKPGKWTVLNVVARLRVVFLKLCAAVIPLSNRTVTDFQINKPALIMEGGIDVSDFQLKGRKTVQDGKGHDICRILYAGALTEANGIPFLLTSFKMIDDDREYVLEVLGRGPLTEEVNRAATSDKRIRAYDFLDRKTYLDKLHEATVLVNPRLPSFPETRYSFPSKLLEYLASGTPVISTVTTDVVSDYKDMMISLEEEDPLAFARLIRETCVSDPEYLFNIGQRAREFVLKNKTWGVQAARVLEFMNKLVDDRK